MSSSAVLPPRYIVLSASPLVAEDIAEVIRARQVTADIVIVQKPAAALQLLGAGASPPSVFAVLRKQVLEDMHFGLAVAASGGRLVLVGSSVPSEMAEREGWILLPEPFSSEMVEDVLQRLHGQADPD